MPSSRKFLAQGRVSKEKVSAFFYGEPGPALAEFLGKKNAGAVYPEIGDFVVKFESGSVKRMTAEEFEDEYAVL